MSHLLYGIARGGVEPLGDGMSAPLLLLAEGHLQAVLEPGAGPPAPTVRTLQAWDRVTRHLADRLPAYLPARFGETVADPAAAHRLLAERAGEWAATLDRVDGCCQMTLHLWGEAAPREDPAPADGSGTSWLEARQRELRARESLPEAEPLLRRRARWIRDSRIRRSASPPLLGTVNDLVPRSEEQAWREAVAEAAAELPRLRVEISGPHAVWAFAEAPE